MQINLGCIAKNMEDLRNEFKNRRRPLVSCADVAAAKAKFGKKRQLKLSDAEKVAESLKKRKEVLLSI